MSASKTEKKAKLFINGNSQAVRLPKEFQFPGTEVYISHEGSRCILSSKPSSWDAFFQNTATLSDDFVVERDQSPPQVREGL